MNFYGSKGIGSADIETSVAGAEILPKGVVNFDFLNDQNCHIKINGGVKIKSIGIASCGDARFWTWNRNSRI